MNSITKSKQLETTMIAYDCTFTLYLQDLQAQMYFPSSFEVQWKTKNNNLLAKTPKFIIKNQQNQAKYDQSLNGTIKMVYDKETEMYLQKDTFIIVNYFINNKPYEIKELGSLKLKMTKFLEYDQEDGMDRSFLNSYFSYRQKQSGKGNGNDGKQITYKMGQQSQQQRFSKTSSTQFYPGEFQYSTKCLKLDNSQYNAKLRFRCQLTDWKQSTVPINELQAEQFSDPIEFMYNVKGSALNGRGNMSSRSRGSVSGSAKKGNRDNLNSQRNSNTNSNEKIYSSSYKKGLFTGRGSDKKAADEYYNAGQQQEQGGDRVNESLHRGVGSSVNNSMNAIGNFNNSISSHDNNKQMRINMVDNSSSSHGKNTRLSKLNHSSQQQSYGDKILTELQQEGSKTVRYQYKNNNFRNTNINNNNNNNSNRQSQIIKKNSSNTSGNNKIINQKNSNNNDSVKQSSQQLQRVIGENRRLQRRIQQLLGENQQIRQQLLVQRQRVESQKQSTKSQQQYIKQQYVEKIKRLQMGLEQQRQKHQSQTHKITQQLQQIQQQNSELTNRVYLLEEQLREKQLYYLSNLQKLEQTDKLKYELTEIRDYTERLEKRLINKYNQRPQMWAEDSSIVDVNLSSRIDSLRNSSNLLNSKANSRIRNNNQVNLVSSITIISQATSTNQLGLGEGKALSVSVTGKDNDTNNNTLHQKQQPQKQEKNKGFNLTNTNKSIPQMSQRQQQHETKTAIINSYYNTNPISNSEISLTNSELRIVQGSTVKMQNQLQYMQMQLYQVKAEVSFQQEKYETECMAHQETKIELYNIQEKLKQTKQQLSQLQTEHLKIIKHYEFTHQNREQMAQQLIDIRQEQMKIKKELFLLKQHKQQQQYEMNIRIKQMRIEQQALKDELQKKQQELKLSKEFLQQSNCKLQQLNKENEQLRLKVAKRKQQNMKLRQQLQTIHKKHEQVSDYLSGLQKQIQEVYQIVEQKEENEANLLSQIQQRDSEITKMGEEIDKLQLSIASLQLTLQNYQQELMLYQDDNLQPSGRGDNQEGEKHYRLFNSDSNEEGLQNQNNSQLANNNKLQTQKQQKPTLPSNQNVQLVQKNKQLISMLNKNANYIVLYQKQKKELTKVNKQLQELKQTQRLYEQVKDLCDQLEKDKKSLESQINNTKAQLNTINQKHQQQINKLHSQLQQQTQQTNKLRQEIKKLTQQKYKVQNISLQQLSKINGLQIRYSKMGKEYKLLQESNKLLEQKFKSYMVQLVNKQEEISMKEIMIKQLVARVEKVTGKASIKDNQTKEHQEQQLQSGSLIKLQSLVLANDYFEQSNVQSKNNNNTSNQQKNNNLNLASSPNEQHLTLIQLLHQYLGKKQKEQQEMDNSQVNYRKTLGEQLRKVHSSQISEEISGFLLQASRKSKGLQLENIMESLGDKVKQLSILINKYKAKAVREINLIQQQLTNRTNSNNRSQLNTISSILQPLQQVQTTITEILAITSYNKNPSSKYTYQNANK